MKYKFRGKTKGGEWVYGSLVETTDFIKAHTRTWIVTRSFGNGGWFNIRSRYYVKPETVGMMVGFDSEGEEVYEGDVIKCELDEVINPWVIGNDGCNAYVWNGINSVRSFEEVGHFEVIGNIFDDESIDEQDY